MEPQGYVFFSAKRLSDLVFFWFENIGEDTIRIMI
jgi:hypothetical protein